MKNGWLEDNPFLLERSIFGILVENLEKPKAFFFLEFIMKFQKNLVFFLGKYTLPETYIAPWKMKFPSWELLSFRGGEIIHRGGG